uniref:Uncharacterized protein n=1 Tax=Cercocebus atys TaxID=9531 RepID=A0A2K5LZ29_CERAT
MSLYRSVAWFTKGLREDTNGYESSSKDFVPHDLEVQVPGIVFLVTGGNGIGKATALEIAKRDKQLLTFHLVCRDQARAEDARGEIIRESGNQNIFLHIVDLSDPKKIWKFVENFKQEHKLHVLINNAGCMVNKRELTEDGLEKNLLPILWVSVYILTTGPIPVLEKEHDPRVITVSSGGMLVQKLNTNDLQCERTAFDGTTVYAQNKVSEMGFPRLHFTHGLRGPFPRDACSGMHINWTIVVHAAPENVSSPRGLPFGEHSSAQTQVGFQQHPGSSHKAATSPLGVSQTHTEQDPSRGIHYPELLRGNEGGEWSLLSPLGSSWLPGGPLGGAAHWILREGRGHSPEPLTTLNRKSISPDGASFI